MVLKLNDLTRGLDRSLATTHGPVSNTIAGASSLGQTLTLESSRILSIANRPEFS